MAIQQTKRQSDLEKRLQLLRRQVYGRESVVSSKYHVVREEKTIENTHTTNYLLREASQLPTTDLTYLRQDLIKILTFASLAIGAQVIIFFLLQNHILKLNFF